MSTKSRILMTVLAVLVIIGITSGSAFAAASNKQLATNFTLVNLSTASADVTINYFKTDGGVWKTADTTSIAGNGGQAIYRQYQDANLTSGSGSVRIDSTQPLAGVVQQVINPSSGQVPTSGAYAAVSEETKDTKFYIPQAAKNGPSATGTANSLIVVQNLEASSITVKVKFIKYGETSVSLDKNLAPIAAYASTYYDVSTESGLTDGFYSASVEVVGSGNIGVISNLYFGADSLVSFNAFPAKSLTNKWQVPLLYSRLSNSLVTSLIIQNLAGTTIPVNDISLTCTKDATSSGQATIETKNTAEIAANGVYYWNAYTQTSLFPTNWYGACTVESASDKGIVVLITNRYISNAEQAGYEAIAGNSTNTTAFVPLMAKRLANNFATTATIQNVTSSPITVDITYTRAADNSVGNATYAENDVSIPANGSIIRNFRLTDQPAGLGIPNGWYGTMKVEGTGAIGIYVQNTYVGSAYGDRLQAYLGFTQP